MPDHGKSTEAVVVVRATSTGLRRAAACPLALVSGTREPPRRTPAAAPPSARSGSPGPVLGCEGEPNYVVDIVGDKVSLADVQRVEHAGDALPLRLLFLAAGRLRRQAEPAQIGHNYQMIAHQVEGEWRPHVASLAITVE
jgi:hypothetical protein